MKSAVSALVDERAGANVRHGTEQCTPGGDLPRVRVPGRRARACSVAFEDDFTDSRKGDADSDKVSIYTPCRHSAARNVTLEKLHSTLVSLGSDRELVGGLFRDGNGVPEILLHPRLFRQMTARDKEQRPHSPCRSTPSRRLCPQGWPGGRRLASWIYYAVDDAVEK